MISLHFSILKMSVLSNLFYRFDEILIKIPTLFLQKYMLNLISNMEMQKPRMAKLICEKHKAEGLTQLGIITRSQ